MKELTIDFEAYDPYIDRGCGSGWVYGYNYPEHSDFEVLGAAVGEEWIEDPKKILKEVMNSELLIMHNASYDIGCILYLMKQAGCSYRDIIKPWLKKIDIYDTEVASRLYISSDRSHSLDTIANKYLNANKDKDALADAVYLAAQADESIELEVQRTANYRAYCDQIISNKNSDDVKLIKLRKSLAKWAIKNLPKLMTVKESKELVITYAKQDASLTTKLRQYFKDKVSDEQVIKYSNVSKICNDYRLKGVRVDLQKAHEVDNTLTQIIAQAATKVYNLAGDEFNIASSSECGAALDRLSIKTPITKKTQKPSVTNEWLETQTHEICKAIRDVRKNTKIHCDFVRKIIQMQEYTCPTSDDKYGRVFPELNLMRAVTGRFSCSSPNIQQIPKRDEEFKKYCRSLYVAEEGEKWYSLDFSNQEGRLQIHYASRLKCAGSEVLKARLCENPNYDIHQAVADMTGMSRANAKIINLGLSYGMGILKLSKALDCDSKEATRMRELYFEYMPYLKELNDKCKSAMGRKKYIKTLMGRKSWTDKPAWVNGELRSFEWKALNKLIQGSAADQTIEAMIWAWEEDIPVVFPVHDELNMSGTLEQAIRLKYIMENCVTLEVPSVTEIEEGDSWCCDTKISDTVIDKYAEVCYGN